MKIVLVGYMASGKSTIGSALAKEKNISFIDLDDYIELKEGKTISEIFNDNGAIYFRKKEHLYLKEVLSKDESFVLALGGGTPCYAGNMDILKAQPSVTSIHLSSKISEIVARLKNEKDKRPLVSKIKNEELNEFVAKHLFERSYFYNQSTHTVNTNDKKVTDLVKELNVLLG